MASIAHHFEFDNVSILSPNHLVSNSSVQIKNNSNLNKFNSSSSIHRPPLLSISQIQSSQANSTSCKSPSSNHNPLDSPQSSKLSSLPRESRRQVRNPRSGSPSSTLPATPVDAPNLRPRRKLHSDQKHQTRISPDDIDDINQKPLLPYQRLNLTHSIPPDTPPVISDHMMIPKSYCSFSLTPLIQPAYNTPRIASKDTHTCIRTKIHSYSASICTQTPVYLSKTLNKLKKVKKSNLPSSPDSLDSSLVLKSSEEQEKWWYWSITCPMTGDGNESSHLTPLRCKDLKRKFDVGQDSEDTSFEIQTRSINRFSSGLQMIHFPN